MRMTLTLACLCSLAFASRSHAGSLDEELVKQIPTVIDSLKKSKVKNVGVMRFRVEEAGKAPRFDESICGSLVKTIEDLLIAGGPPKVSDAMGVIRDAGD